MIHPAPAAGVAISWIVVNTNPREERFAVENLSRRLFVGYCPMLAKRIRHARRSELVLRPMFPAHVFAGLHAASQWRPILLTPGVRAVVQSGGLPNFLPSDFVEALRRCEAGGKIVAPGSPGNGRQPGIGPGTHYSGLITAMVEMTERERLLALVGLLGPAKDVSGVGTTPARHGK